MARSYSPEEVDEALLAVRLKGSLTRAAAQTKIPLSTLSQWVNDKHAARYKQLSDELAPRLEAQLVARMQAVADQAADVATEAVEATRAALHKSQAPMPEQDDYDDRKQYNVALHHWQNTQTQAAKDASLLSGTAKNLIFSVGISTDKSLLLQGRPTEIHANQSSDDDLKAIARMLHVTLEGTAEEVADTPTAALHGETWSANAHTRELNA